MADVSVQMGVSGVSQFKSQMAQAQASVKNIDAALKLNEKQYKATGDAEAYMQNKTTQLNSKLQAQQNAVKSAENALKAMRESGVDPLSVSYKNMETQLLNAQSAVLDTQSQINELGTESVEAAGKTDQLVTSLQGLNKKVSLEQVIRGIDSITSGMEKAAQKAVDLGKKIWENITDSARWADDTATQAMILNMDVEDYQRYKKVFDTVGELTVQEWQKAKLKVQKAINDPTQDQTNILNLLGIQTHEGQQGKYGWVEGAARNFEDVFWDIGETLIRKVESGELTQDVADVYANAIFGKGFAELNPMFHLGKTGFEEALEAQTVASKEAIEANAQLNDQLNKLKGDFETLQQEVLGGLAPALTKVSEVLDGLLTRLIEYLQTPEGQEALERMGKAVEGIFSDISKIDPEQVVQGFADVFDGIIKGLEWLDKNSGNLVTAMGIIVSGWGALKITGGALQVLQLLNGLKELKSTKKIQIPELDGGGNANTGVGEQTVTTENVSSQNVTTGNFTTANVTTGNTTTEHVQTMYVTNMVGGQGSGQTPGTSPVVNNGSGGSGLNGYTPLLLPNGNSVGGGEELRLPGVDNVTIDGNGTNINLPGGGNNDLIRLDPSDYSIDEGEAATAAASIWEIIRMKVGGAAQSLTGLDPTGVTALIPQWLADNTTFGRALQEGKTLDEAAGEAAKAIQQLPQEIANRYQETVDNQYKALFGMDTTQLAETFTAIWGRSMELLQIANDAVEDEHADADAQLAGIGPDDDGYFDDGWSIEDINRYFEEQDEKVQIPSEPDLGPNAREEVEEMIQELGTFEIPATIKITGPLGPGGILHGGGGSSKDLVFESTLPNYHANGLWSVPFDGYRAILHKGERIVPAREAGGSRNFSSNLYVESMYMNNGTDAEGLAAAMAAAQKRTMSGYGS